MSMVEKVSASLDALTLDDEDQAAAELALVYATELDRAGIVRARADKAVRAVVEQGLDPDVYEMVTALRAKLSERECVDRIGRDLHALLNELGATPKARAAAGKKSGHGGRQAPASAGKLALARLRSVP